MDRSNDSAPRSDMPIAASTARIARPAHGFTISRSAATRPVLSPGAFRSGRRSRALQLSWVGLVRASQ